MAGGNGCSCCSTGTVAVLPRHERLWDGLAGCWCACHAKAGVGTHFPDDESPRITAFARRAGQCVPRQQGIRGQHHRTPSAPFSYGLPPDCPSRLPELLPCRGNTVLSEVAGAIRPYWQVRSCRTGWEWIARRPRHTTLQRNCQPQRISRRRNVRCYIAIVACYQASLLLVAPGIMTTCLNAQARKSLTSHSHPPRPPLRKPPTSRGRTGRTQPPSRSAGSAAKRQVRPASRSSGRSSARKLLVRRRRGCGRSGRSYSWLPRLTLFWVREREHRLIQLQVVYIDPVDELIPRPCDLQQHGYPLQGRKPAWRMLHRNHSGLMRRTGPSGWT